MLGRYGRFGLSFGTGSSLVFVLRLIDRPPVLAQFLKKYLASAVFLCT